MALTAIGNLAGTSRARGDVAALSVEVVDGSGNQVASFGGSGGTSHADDAAFTIGSASSITPTGFLADETTPDAVDEGDVGVPRMTLTRKPYAVITDPTSEQNAGVDASGHLQVDIAADSVGIGGGTQYTEGDTDATITGNALLFEGAADTLIAAPGTAANGLDVDVTRVTGTVTVDGSGVTQPVSDAGGALTIDWAGTAPPIGAGTEAAALRVTLATDSTGLVSVDDNGGALTVDNGGTFVVQEDGAALTALQLIDNIVVVEDAAHGSGDSGVMPLAVRNDVLAALAGSDGDYAPVQVSALGALFATLAPETTGGLTIFRSIDLDESEEAVKATAGQLYGYYFSNVSASARFLKFYNLTVGNTTVGTSTPVLTFPLPATSAGHVPWPHGIAFDTAITVAVTTAVADADTGAPGANDVVLNVFYV